MQEEILNIEYNRKLLVIKALNKLPSQKYAASRLGISERQLYRLKKIYNIMQVEGGEWAEIQKIPKKQYDSSISFTMAH